MYYIAHTTALICCFSIQILLASTVSMEDNFFKTQQQFINALVEKRDLDGLKARSLRLAQLMALKNARQNPQSFIMQKKILSLIGIIEQEQYKIIAEKNASLEKQKTHKREKKARQKAKKQAQELHNPPAEQEACMQFSKNVLLDNRSELQEPLEGTICKPSDPNTALLISIKDGKIIQYATNETFEGELESPFQSNSPSQSWTTYLLSFFWKTKIK